MLNRPVLVDTGPLIASYNNLEPDHERCKRQLTEIPLGKAYTCWPVITEAAYLLRRRPDEREHLLSMVRNGDLSLLTLTEEDVDAVQRIFAKYYDHQIDLADACLLHLADREGIDAIFTIDRRHFEMFRRTDGTSLQLLPE